MKILDLIKRDYLILLFLALMTFISYGQILQMYFWLDDYTGLYFLQQDRLYWWPYHSISVLYGLLYSIWGLQTQWYFLTMIIFYILAAFLMYLLFLIILRIRILALLLALIFASGYTGQDGMKMFFGGGLGTIIGINGLVLSIICLFKYHEAKKLKWFILSIFSLFIILEFALYRFATAVLALILTDFILSFRRHKGNILSQFRGAAIRCSLFLITFYVQSVLWPSHKILEVSGYKLMAPLGYSEWTGLFSRPEMLLTFINWQNFASVIGVFWNLFFPTVFRDELYFFILRSKFSTFFTSGWFWLSGIPAVSFAVITIVCFLTIYFKGRVLIKSAFMVCIFSFIFFWGELVNNSLQYTPLDKISILNGGIILILLALIVNYSFFKKYIFFFLSLTAGILSLLFITKSGQIFESSHYYLLPGAIIPPFFAIFFIEKGIIINKGKSRRVSWILFLLPVLSIIFLHLLASLKTQGKFIEAESKHARNFYTLIRKHLPQINDKKIIYVEGSSKELNHTIGSIQRVGALSSEAVYAVHYGTKLENIILPDNLSEIPAILERTPKLKPEDIFTFIYNGEELIDTSEGIRSLLFKPKQPVKISSDYWYAEPANSLISKDKSIVEFRTVYYKFLQYTLGVYPRVFVKPGQMVPSQLPVKASLKISTSLDKALPVPYYHLFNRSEYPGSDLWQEILSWEISQCDKGALTGFFECVEIQSQAKNLLNKVKKGDLIFTWQYNTYGTLSQNKFSEIEIPLDGNWHEYEIFISGGGQNLERFELSYISFPGIIKIKDLQFEYSR